MDNSVLYDKGFCKINYSTTDKYITIQWFGFPRSNDFREACNMVVDFMIKFKTGKLLTDNRKAKIFSVNDQKWLNSEWLPNAIKAGYYCSATLINDDVFVKTAVNNISSKRDQKTIKSKLFTNENDAIIWLQSI